jgi:hypothetical protein
VVKGATDTFSREGVSGRAETAGGDMFKTVPSGGDAYLFKHIIHDWNDEACVTVLKNVREVMNPSGRVLVIEGVVPPPGVPSFARLLDLEMLAVTSGGKERTEAEYGALFAKAGLKLTRVIPTPGPLQVIEAVRA